MAAPVVNKGFCEYDIFGNRLKTGSIKAGLCIQNFCFKIKI